MKPIIAAIAVAALLNLDDARELKWRDYVDSQLSQTDDRILPPPPDIAVYFGNHAAELNAFRVHPATVEKYPNHILLTRILVAHALSHHDWNDLAAAWEMQRDLWAKRDLSARMIALAGSRMINGAARKMPLPAPRWFGEVLAFDARSAILDSHLKIAEDVSDGHASHDLSDSALQRFVDTLREPYDRAVARDVKEALRTASQAMAASRECGLDDDEFTRRITASLGLWNYLRINVPSLGIVWQRAARFNAEREATAKILDIKSGRVPSAASQCSDGTWVVTPGHIRFTKQIEGQIPLEY